MLHQKKVTHVVILWPVDIIPLNIPHYYSIIGLPKDIHHRTFLSLILELTVETRKRRKESEGLEWLGKGSVSLGERTETSI